ncbi:hypothetical protein HAX54_043413 [Datura stramonium]|uniref:Transmembrane protein n=1 Tax=Datura stramonium TaxID=4076 RepID=A0ABS8SNI8_DATST|nr:hypothetical protein [Datura stramonium]
MGCHLHPLHYHHSQLCRNAKVNSLLFYWILFENVMAFHRTKATFIGLLEARRANEWVVTGLGDALRTRTRNETYQESPRLSIWRQHKTMSSVENHRALHPPIINNQIVPTCGILPQELGFAAFLFFCGLYDVLYGKRQYFVYVFLQVITFTIAGLGYVGTIVPS